MLIIQILIFLVATLTWSMQFEKGFGLDTDTQKIESQVESMEGSVDRTRRGIGDYIRKLWPWQKTVENTKQEGPGLEEKSNDGFFGYFSNSNGGQKPVVDKPEEKSKNNFLGWLPRGYNRDSDKPRKIALAEGSGKITGSGIVVGEVQAGSPDGATGYARGFAGDGDFTGYGRGLVIVNQKDN